MAIPNRLQIGPPTPITPEPPLVSFQETQISFGANNVNVDAMNFIAENYTNIAKIGLKFGEDLLLLQLEKEKWKKKKRRQMAEARVLAGQEQELMFAARHRLQLHRQDPHLTEAELEDARKRAYPENFEGVRSPDYYQWDDLHGTDFTGPINTRPENPS